jgi:hypothetical protein
MTAGNLAPPGVQTDSPDSRSHRRQIASVVNTLAQKLFTPAPVSTNTAAGDASQVINCQGNAVLLTGYIRLSAGSSYTLKRGATTLVTLYAPATGVNINFTWVDAPGAGQFTYSTNSGATSAATLSATELK